MRYFLSLAVLALVAVPGDAVIVSYGFPIDMDHFSTSVDARIQEIDLLPSPTAAELKERAALAKISTGLNAYGGGTSKADLGLAAKSLGAAYKATQSPGVSSRAPQLLFGIHSMIATSRYEAHAEKVKLTNAANQAKIDAAIAKADAIVDAVQLEPNWGTVAKAYAKAVAAFDKAKASALSLQAKEAGGKPAGTLSCRWDSVNFDSDRDFATATWNSGTGGFAMGGQMSGNPRYVLSVTSTGVFGPGTFGLVGGSGGITAIAGLVPQNMWLITSGTLTIDVLTASKATGTFSFTALSGSTGTISVIEGVFDLPVD